MRESIYLWATTAEAVGTVMIVFIVTMIGVNIFKWKKERNRK